jgi:glycine cleavage system H protein
MNIPGNLKYTKDHEWIRIEGNAGIIGITDYAQAELGDIVFIDINPSVTGIIAGESFGTIEAVKTVSDMFAPVSGSVIELNPKLNAEPQLVNTDPYGEGWIIKIEISDPSRLDGLLSPAEYQSQLGQ